MDLRGTRAVARLAACESRRRDSNAGALRCRRLWSPDEGWQAPDQRSADSVDWLSTTAIKWALVRCHTNAKDSRDDGRSILPSSEPSARCGDVRAPCSCHGDQLTSRVRNVRTSLPEHLTSRINRCNARTQVLALHEQCVARFAQAMRDIRLYFRRKVCADV